MQPGHLPLPNGLGLRHLDEAGRPIVTGVAPNGLTSAGDRARKNGHHIPWMASTQLAIVDAASPMATPHVQYPVGCRS